MTCRSEAERAWLVVRRRARVVGVDSLGALVDALVLGMLRQALGDL